MGVFLSPMQYQVIDQGMSDIETFLNFAGYIPIIHGVSGPLRQILGVIELVVSTALIVFNSLFLYSASSSEKASLMRQVKLLCSYQKHGIFNIMRGAVESLPFVNYLLLFYDFANFRQAYCFENSKVYENPPSFVLTSDAGTQS